MVNMNIIVNPPTLKTNINNLENISKYYENKKTTFSSP